jgi:hypothetical protein
LPARLQPLQTASQLIPLSPLLPVCDSDLLKSLLSVEQLSRGLRRIPM